MRRVILQEFVTLDGLAAGPKDSVEYVPASMKGDESFGREAQTGRKKEMKGVQLSPFCVGLPTLSSDSELICVMASLGMSAGRRGEELSCAQ